jgi:hypothetical protein
MGKELKQAGNRESRPQYDINPSFVVKTTWKSSASTAEPNIKKTISYFLSKQFISVICVIYDSQKAKRLFPAEE